MKCSLAWIAAWVLIAGALDAGESTRNPAGNKGGGPLAGLPSAPGPHIGKVKALGDNEWLELGSPEPDPKWGRARGRAWGGKAFALAPEMRGAFFAGEGAHAFVKPDGHGMDDMWVYDIHAHRWICIYPGTDTKSFNQQVKDGEILLNEHGQVIDKDGQPIPGHLLIHAWGFLAYDTHRQKFTICRDTPGFYRYFMPGGKELMDWGQQGRRHHVGLPVREGQRWRVMSFEADRSACHLQLGSVKEAFHPRCCPWGIADPAS